MVLPDKNVDVLYLEFGDSARKVCVRWWIEDYHKKIITQQGQYLPGKALTEAGIDLPFSIYELHLTMQRESADE